MKTNKIILSILSILIVLVAVLPLANAQVVDATSFWDSADTIMQGESAEAVVIVTGYIPETYDLTVCLINQNNNEIYCGIENEQSSIQIPVFEETGYGHSEYSFVIPETVTSNLLGVYDVVATVVDFNGEVFVTNPIQLTVLENHAPEFVTYPNQLYINVGGEYNYEGIVIDIDGDVISMTSNMPSWLSLDYESSLMQNLQNMKPNVSLNSNLVPTSARVPSIISTIMFGGNPNPLSQLRPVVSQTQDQTNSVDFVVS